MEKNNNRITDRIIWKDGHVSAISSEEAFRKQYEVVTKTSSKWHMKIGDHKFVWIANCWMEL